MAPAFDSRREAAFVFLQGREEVDPKRIGFIGHSEGGVVAPIVAARNRAVGFVVLLNGPATPLGDLLVHQIELVGRAEGVSVDIIRKQQDVTRKAIARLKRGESLEPLEAELAVACEPRCGDRADAGKAERAVMERPWFRHFVSLDPRPTLARVRCPMLALAGSLDVQVHPATNLSALRDVMKGRRIDGWSRRSWTA